MTVAAAMSSTRELQAWRLIAAASIGNALEWFDFVVYGFLAVVMARLFFPTANDTLSLLLTFATFGVPFLMRPLGAVLLGSYGDRRGRKAALLLSIALMMLGTAIIAGCPTYASIGPAAPILILFARFLQGFSAGGEFGSATAFLAEQNPARRGFFASWQFASQGLTTVLATAFGAVLAGALTTEQLESWGWRVPFVFGLLLGPVAYYIRRHLDETVEFKAMQVSRSPLRETLSDTKRMLLIGLASVVLSTVGTYAVLFMPTYAMRQLGLPPADSYLAGLLTGAIQVLLIPVAGSMSDRYGRLPLAFASAGIMLIASYPLFVWLAAVPKLSTLLLVQAIFGVLLASYVGPLPAFMAELFPVRLRTTGLAISYSLAVAIFGGFAPFIYAWLIELTGSKLAPSFYLTVAAAISLCALLAARRLGFR
jgi:MHS family proline/betaine transporter-like MFS transporter